MYSLWLSQNILDLSWIFGDAADYAPVRLLAMVLQCALILLATFLLGHVSKYLVDYAAKQLTKRGAYSPKAATLNSLARSLVRYVIYFFGLFSLLAVFGIPSESILAVAGVGSIAIGFAAQSIVKDIINGIFILIENYFNVGDVVTLGAYTGKVVSIGMRTTKLLTDDGQLHIIPNSEIKIITRDAEEKSADKATNVDEKGKEYQE